MTLIEVVAGLALMASILVCVLYLKTSYAHQQALADRHLRALAAADSLLSNWWREPLKISRNASGEMNGSSPLRWRTQRLRNPEVERLGAELVRLQIIDGNVIDSRQDVMASVDIVLPLEGN